MASSRSEHGVFQKAMLVSGRDACGNPISVKCAQAQIRKIIDSISHDAPESDRENISHLRDFLSYEMDPRNFILNFIVTIEQAHGILVDEPGEDNFPERAKRLLDKCPKSKILKLFYYLVVSKYKKHIMGSALKVAVATGILLALVHAHTNGKYAYLAATIPTIVFIAHRLSDKSRDEALALVYGMDPRNEYHYLFPAEAAETHGGLQKNRYHALGGVANACICICVILLLLAFLLIVCSPVLIPLGQPIPNLPS